MTRISRPGVTVHPLSHAFRDYRALFDPRYTIAPIDRHPNAAADALIADYVIREVLHDAPE